MRPRSLARRLALQYCFMADLNGTPEPEPVSRFLRDHCDTPAAAPFAQALIEHTIGTWEAIDACIAAAAENWDLRRIAAVERNVLRVAVGELLTGETPPNVVLDEAITLAKVFGSADSGAFVNGVLDRIRKTLQHRE